jgi:hypothetical protein
MVATLLILARITLSLVLVPAIAAKSGRADHLAASISRWRIGPGAAARPAARSVVAAEVAILLTVSSGVGLRFGAMLAIALFGVIAVAAASVMVRHISTTCGCFKAGGNEQVNATTVVRALLLMAIAVAIAYWSDWSIGPDPRWSVALVVLVAPLCVAIIRRVVRPRYPTPIRAT